jgi:redox-sensitive bicupin YhaK (pirin superfamily)
VQLWVNLPAKDKMSPPQYQDIASSRIPTGTLPGGGQLRVIAGELAGLQGPARTYSPVVVADLTLSSGQTETLTVPASYSLMAYVLRGSATINGKLVSRGQIALTNSDGDMISIGTTTDAKLLILAGEPIQEPLAVYGPFVMNTREEILAAFDDFQNGRMGVLN